MEPRNDVLTLTDIPNIGKAMLRDLQSLGIHTPTQLVGKDPLALYWQLCDLTGHRQDPCVLDTFISAVRYMEGAPARKWWEYTAERKAMMDRL